MTQCRVYRNPTRETRSRTPYLLDVQSDLLSELATRVVVPLVHQRYLKSALQRLHPLLEVEGHKVVMATAELAAVSVRMLVEEVADLSWKRAEIVGALDFLLTGI